MESLAGGEDNVPRLAHAADAAPQSASRKAPDPVTTDREPLPRGTAPAGLRSADALQRAQTSKGRASADETVSAEDALRQECIRLVLQAQQGDQDAFQKFVEITQNRISRVVRSVVHCDRIAAEDLVQEVFVRVWKALPRFRGESVLPWIHAVATNVAISEWRQQRAQKRAHKPLSIDAPIAGTDDLRIEPPSRERMPDDLSGQREFAAKVRSMVLELPDEFRLPLVLRELEGMSYEEVAVALSLPGGTVRSRIHRARCMLQQMLQGFEP